MGLFGRFDGRGVVMVGGVWLVACLGLRVGVNVEWGLVYDEEPVSKNILTRIPFSNSLACQ
jgi:hypothetical protein